jgi:23S rRNA pseudouridine1911/1915/1917 synthase
VETETNRTFSYEISDSAERTRLDIFLSSCSISLTRSRIQTLIKNGFVRVNNSPSKPSYQLRLGDRVSLSIPDPVPQVLSPEPVEFEVIHEDSSLIVLNKPAGLVVHPAPGHSAGTLVHGLLQHCRNLSGIGGVLRPGVVHRLDKDTSGLMVVAKNDHAHGLLSSQFKAGTVKKQYLALVHGTVEGNEGMIDLPIARHPVRRKEMSVAPSKGKRALSLWHKIEDFRSGFSLLSISIKTGRTHQIRVHLSHKGHPVVGDAVYGYGRRWWKGHPLVKKDKDIVHLIKRQMLHSNCLGFIHPDHGSHVEFRVPLPDDMKEVIDALA